MKLEEFVIKWENKPCDWDGKFGNQCVDLFRQYCQEVLGVPQNPPVVGAVDLWTTYLKDYFTAIPNTPAGVPKFGDVIIWGTGIGQYGHVAIFLSGDTKSFVSFDQNYPTGSVCHRQTHDYRNVLGWLHPVGADNQKMAALLADLRILIAKYAYS